MSDDRSLYFFFNEWTGLIKVGIAGSVFERQEALECAVGVRLQLLSTLENGADLEKPLHQALFATREVGEWFRPSVELVAIAKAPTREAIDALIQKRQPAVQAHLAELFARDAQRRERQAEERARVREQKRKEDERKRVRAEKAAEAKAKRKKAAAKKHREDLRAWREANTEALAAQGLVVRSPVPEAHLLSEPEKQRKRNQQLIGLAPGIIQ